MKKLIIWIIILCGLSQAKSQNEIKYPIIKEYKQVINHEKKSVITDVRVVIEQTQVTILFANPQTNFKEIFKKESHKIEKYVGEMPKDEKGYSAQVFLCERDFIFTVNIKSLSDHWCMLSHKKLEGHTIFQDPFIKP